jgi:uncharacterized protein YacL
METLRKFLNILVLLFLVFAVLVLLNIISLEYLDSTLTNFNPENFLKTVFGVAAGLLLVQLLVSNLNILALKRERIVLSNRVNELKANLYDKKVHEARENRPAGTDSSRPAPIFPPDTLQ